MQSRIKDVGVPVATMVFYSNMENYEEVDNFLEACANGKSDSMLYLMKRIRLMYGLD